MAVHRIRLMGPWDFDWSGTDSSSASPQRGSIKMPCTWRSLFGNEKGHATFSRRFHRPTNLESHEKVVLVFSGLGGDGDVSLNGVRLRSFTLADQTLECDVTERLLPFNQLQVAIRFDPTVGNEAPGGLYEPVIIEIRSPD